ncbi:hypothetical protein [Nocardia sp. NPDC004604]|uniref:hypothetical protein n=1 Tax=Nocardia sp. NPDC004604 TaxID=3157013 RepID=UPI0033B15B82
MNRFAAMVHQRLAEAEANAIRGAGKPAEVAIREDEQRTQAAFNKKWPKTVKRAVGHRNSGAGFDASIRTYATRGRASQQMAEVIQNAVFPNQNIQ